MRILALVDQEAYPGDDPEEMEFDVFEALRGLGHELSVLPFGPDVMKTIDALKNCASDVVFNLTERFEGDRRKDLNIAALLELLHLPYTGTGPSGLALCRDKALCKRVLGYDHIRVPKFAVVNNGHLPAASKLEFPLIVKPMYSDGSDGIALASLVKDEKELEERARIIHERQNQPAICEEFIDGREIYVGVIGNGRLQVFPPRELKFGKDEDCPPIATSRVKWDCAYRKKWKIEYADADLPAELASEIAQLSKQVFRLLQMDGYGRIDLRVTPGGEIVFLEANPNPDLSRDADLAAAAAKADVTYEALLERIIHLAGS